MFRPFAQVDVFAETAFAGNPVAVVLGAAGLETEAMQRFANWTNLSETTFVLPPTSSEADYRVRIFSPTQEMPFAGHPTLGTCHAWLEHGGMPRDPGVVVQECGIGLVRIRRDTSGLAFAAPPRIRSGPVDPQLVAKVVGQLRIEPTQVVEAEWLDNGVPWLGIVMRSVDDVLAVQPGLVDEDVAVIAETPSGSETAFEVRAFFPKDGMTAEDPVTGSLNAALADWLVRSGRVVPPYIVSQGTALGRAGRVRVERDGDVLWIGGGTRTMISGTLSM
jgi:PhzF family phenazine biosynthesis protein